MTAPTVFISSTISDLLAERDAAARAIASIGFQAVRSETLGSRSASPHDACLDMVKASDIYLGICGRNYGWVHPTLGVSATELEFLEARRLLKPLLVYIKATTEHDPTASAFISRVRSFDHGLFTRPAFENLDQLADWIRQDLLVLAGEAFTLAGATHPAGGTALLSAAHRERFPGSTRPTYINLVPTISDNDYVVRREVLDSVARHYDSTDRIVAVQGIGGSGKTVVALSYANTTEYSGRYNHIGWVNASASFVDAMINDLYHPLCGTDRALMGEPDTDYGLVLRAMLALPGRNLLIIDGADRPHDLVRHLDQLFHTRWDILLTTRWRPAEIALVAVDEMSIPDATALFQRFCTKTGTDENLLRLLQAVGRHAYLVELSAKLIARHPNLTIDSCIRLLNGPQIIASLAEQPMPHVGPLAPDRRSRTLQERLASLLAFDELDSDERKVVASLSLLPSVALGLAQVMNLLLPESGDLESLRSTLNSLDRRGWVRLTNNSLRIHPMAQAIACLRTSPDVDGCTTMIHSLLHLTAPSDVEFDRPIGWIPYCETLFARISGRSLDLAALASRVALLLEATGSFENAIQYHLLALDIRSELQGTDHPDTATAMDQTGLCWLFIGNLQMAEAKIRQAFAIRKQVLPSDDLDLATSWNNLGFVSRRLDQPGQAVDCYQEALSIYSRHNAPSFAHSLTCNNLSMAYRDLGRLDLALDFAFRGLKIREQLLPSTHPSFGNSYNAIALLYLERGDAALAVQYARKAVNHRESVLAPLHPDTGIALHTLARAFAAAQEDDLARQAIGKALHTFRQSLRPDHPNIARAMADAAAMGHIVDLRFR